MPPPGCAPVTHPSRASRSRPALTSCDRRHQHPQRSGNEGDGSSVNRRPHAGEPSPIPDEEVVPSRLIALSILFFLMAFVFWILAVMRAHQERTLAFWYAVVLNNAGYLTLVFYSVTSD